MPSRAAILDAVEAHVRAALPSAVVAQRRLFPVVLANGGHANLMLESQVSTPLGGSGDPDDPVRLSHTLRLGVHLRMKAPASDIEAALDAATSAIEARIAADATLGGLVTLIHASDLTPEFAGAGDVQAETATGLHRLVLTVAWRD